MKYFKHDCDALDNKDIQYAIEIFGGDGYMLFFGLMEMVGKEMHRVKKREPKAEIRWTEVRRKFHISRTKVERFLNLCAERLNFSYTINQESFNITLHNLLQRHDEYFGKSGQTPDNVPTDSGQTRDIVHSSPSHNQNQISESELKGLKKSLKEKAVDNFQEPVPKQTDFFLNLNKDQIDLIKYEIAEALNHAKDSQANQVNFRELRERVTAYVKKNNVPPEKQFSYALKSAKDIAKPKPELTEEKCSM